ncbi:MAG: hypothetical protein K5840_01345, partial [Eubacterium sp.]|nr:hypothetical protein [Eubacterium sp.]
MSFATYNLLQAIFVAIAYSVCVILLPAAVIYPRIKRHPGPVRLLIYVVVGNFYMFNAVSILELLHISNTFTQWLLLLLVGFAAGSRLRGVTMMWCIEQVLETFRRLLLGILGWNTFAARIRGAIKSAVKWCILWFWNCVIKHLPEWVLTAGLVALGAYAIGTQQQVDYGYIASDELVHNWWINALSSNDMYVAGIYPMGFHCVIYYLHAVFGFPVAVLLRHFADVQYIYVALVGTWFLQEV